mmetsp:Transcript_31935/g.55026  ORF Transcript_31935/g.55026 Transcript_31935/m.55026 type:complete len:132 (-) Transcript_31935:916-1311(-)
MDIWSLYRKSQDGLGKPVDIERYGDKVRYYTGQESIGRENTRTSEYYAQLGLIYAGALASYLYITKHRIPFLRAMSTLTLIGVPLHLILIRKGHDSPLSILREKSLEERLELYPEARRALERAIEAKVKSS